MLKTQICVTRPLLCVNMTEAYTIIREVDFVFILVEFKYIATSAVSFKTLYRVSTYQIPTILILLLLLFRFSMIHWNCIFYVDNTDVLRYAI